MLYLFSVYLSVCIFDVFCRKEAQFDPTIIKKTDSESSEQHCHLLEETLTNCRFRVREHSKVLLSVRDSSASREDSDLRTS